MPCTHAPASGCALMNHRLHPASGIWTWLHLIPCPLTRRVPKTILCQISPAVAAGLFLDCNSTKCRLVSMRHALLPGFTPAISVQTHVLQHRHPHFALHTTLGLLNRRTLRLGVTPWVVPVGPRQTFPRIHFPLFVSRTCF